MEELMKTVLTQVPHMGILAVVVISFVKYLQHKDKLMEISFSKRDEIIRSMNDQNAVAREQSRIIIEKNTIAATSNTDAMRNMTRVLEEFLKRRNH